MSTEPICKTITVIDSASYEWELEATKWASGEYGEVCVYRGKEMIATFYYPAAIGYAGQLIEVELVEMGLAGDEE